MTQRDKNADYNATREKSLEANSQRGKGERLSAVTNSPAPGVMKPNKDGRTNEGPLCLHQVIGQAG